uniref:hypothetical protein n=1 Tax=Candidatus Entotheonella palauensis TaxID=93172 RepID=UPI00117759BC
MPEYTRQMAMDFFYAFDNFANPSWPAVNPPPPDVEFATDATKNAEGVFGVGQMKVDTFGKKFFHTL